MTKKETRVFFTSDD